MRGKPFHRNRSLRRSPFLAIAFLVTSSAPAAAQWDFIITVGPTVADFSGDYVESSIGTWGIVGGFLTQWRFAGNWALEGGLNVISQKGAFQVASAVPDSIVGIIYDYRTGYIEIPVSLNYLFPIADNAWDIRVFGGATPAFGSTCEIKPSDQFSFNTDCAADLPGGEFETFDLLVHFGVGFDRIFKGGSGFGFDARYSIGTQNVLGEAAANGLSVKNRVLDIKPRVFMPLVGGRR